jgi:hypothetical protein
MEHLECIELCADSSAEQVNVWKLGDWLYIL